MKPEKFSLPEEDICPNCGVDLSGPYCSSCGQRQADLDRPFREIVGEIMESFLSFDTRIFRTLWPLISRPGWLTVEFLAGRRARFIHPFKLYFAFSVMLFLAVAFTGNMTVQITSSGDRPVVGIQIDTTESEQGGDDESETGSDEPSFIRRSVDAVLELLKSDPDRLKQLFTDRFAKSVILLVPIFALLLRVLYWRKLYVAHLVFSLHLHSFAFLAMTVGRVQDWSTGSPQGQGWGNAVAVVVIAAYTFFALRRVYGQGRFTTVLKMGALLVGYLVALLVTLALTLVLTAMTL